MAFVQGYLFFWQGCVERVAEGGDVIEDVVFSQRELFAFVYDGLPLFESVVCGQTVDDFDRLFKIEYVNGLK
jgi:hypothetical protein